jgi:hypothetical protein
VPYIDADSRTRIAATGEPQTTGELNYVLTLEIIAYLKRKGKSYQTLSEITAALDNAKDEFVRRVVSRYESRKAVDNGDVYEGV